jgi:hypothetical protein
MGRRRRTRPNQLRQVDFAALGMRWLPLGRPPLNASERHLRDQWAVQHWESDPVGALRNSTGLVIKEFHLLFCKSLVEDHRCGRVRQQPRARARDATIRRQLGA